MKVFTDDTLVRLLGSAELSPRKRAHLNLHSSYSDKVQRLLIALVKGSFVEPHYHELPHQWEMFVVINGLLCVKQYDKDLTVVSELLIGDGQATKLIEFLPGDIHSVECMSDSALMLEVKEGPFNPEYAKVLF